MTKNLSLEIVIPLWNEFDNLPKLVENISNTLENSILNLSFTLINNGSTDDSESRLTELTNFMPKIRVLNLPVNENYGGGVKRGLLESAADWVGYMPGDNQIDSKVINDICINFKSEMTLDKYFLVKGRRIKRSDSIETQLVSRFYSKLVNSLFKLKDIDVNALPKIFNRHLVQDPAFKHLDNSFLFDLDLLLLAKANKYDIIEVPIELHPRFQGTSSWSSTRFKIYVMMLFKVLRRKCSGGL